MDAVKVIISLLMFVIVLIGIQKKYNPITVLLMTGMGVILIYGGLTGITSAANTTGNVWLDAFEVFGEQAVSYFSSSGIIIIWVLGYVSYMNYLKASNLFAHYLSAPLRKLKNPYLVGALVILLALIFVTALPSGVAIVALLFGVVYPIMKSVGLSTYSSVSAITLGCAMYLAPGNPGLNNILVLFESPVTASDLFREGLPYLAIYVVVVMVVYIFVSKAADKRAAASQETDGAVNESDAAQIDKPAWYALLPLLPIVFVLVFSSLVVKSVTISCMGACTLSFCIVFVIELIRTRKAKQVFEDTMEFYKGMGQSFAFACMVGIAGMVFSTALTTVGGIQILANMLTSITGLSILMIIVFFTIIYALLFFVTGTFAISMFSITPILYSTLTSINRPDLFVPTMLCLLLFGQAIGQACTPICAATLFISGATGIPPTAVSKRNALPSIIGGFAAMAAVLIFMT